MPGQPLAVDHEEVKLVALQIGVREAARQFDLPEDTVKTWSRREGWLKEQEEKEEREWKMRQGLRERQGLNPIEPNAGEILRNYSGNTRLKLAVTVDKQAETLAVKDGDELILMSQQVKQVIDGAAKLHAWDSGSASLSIRMDIVNQCSESGPVIDV